MKLKFLTVALVLALAVATAASARAATSDCPPGTSDPSYCESGGSSVAIEEPIDIDEHWVVLTGMRAYCAQGLPKACKVDVVVSARLKLGKRKKDVVIGRKSFSVSSGSDLALLVPITKNKKIRKAIIKLRSITLTVAATIYPPSGPQKRLVNTQTMQLR